MTPETGYFLDKAQKLLIEADSVLAINLFDVAGRMAYLAGFHAAQAFISEQTGRSVKTHRGVRTELHRLTKGDPNFEAELRSFLAQNYSLKTIADYEIGPEAEVSAERAHQCGAQAKRFVAHFEHALGPSRPESGTAP